MRTGLNYSLNAYQASIQSKKLAFKGDFEDIIVISKTKNSPNEVDLAKRKFFGAKRSIHPTPERLKIVETAIDDPATKGAWKGLFRSIATVWKQALK